MAENQNDKVKGQQEQGGKSPARPVIVIIAAVVLVLGVVYMMKSGGMIDMGTSRTDAELSKIAPASADPAATEGGDATAGSEQAGQEIVQGDPIVAKIDGTEIKRSEVFNFIGQLPQQTRQQIPVQNLFPMALNQVVNNKLVEMKAEQANLASDEEVQAMVEQARDQAIRSVFLQRKVEEEVTEQDLKSAYDEYVNTLEGVEETHARHILVESEDEAKALIAQLDEGADFVELAKEHSTGPTGENGGDLGYFAQNEMVPEFADAAFALEVGAHSADPVKTQFGWHVIKAEDRRERKAPEFEAVKSQLQNQLQQEALGNLITKWKQEVNIKTYDINGQETAQGGQGAPQGEEQQPTAKN